MKYFSFYSTIVLIIINVNICAAKKQKLFTDDNSTLELTINIASNYNFDCREAKISYKHKKKIKEYNVIIKEKRKDFNDNLRIYKLDFKNKKTKGSIFYNCGKIDIISNFNEFDDAKLELIKREYFIYKLYNIFTPESFKVRFVKINLLSKNKKKLTSFGFILENKNRMAKRNDSFEFEKKKIHQEATDYKKITRLCLFQYMIGNTNWYIPTLHNIVLIKLSKYHRPVQVPMHFQQSEIIKINANSTHDNLEYTGFKRTEEELNETIQLFLEKKSEIMKFTSKFNILSKTDRNNIIRYFNDFYTIFNNPQKVKTRFIDNSRREFYK